ncbi:MAG: 1-deoxy-D-xylulose-5-phosphate reductoisomerase [Thermodesulfobacteriota bacterium]
MLNYISSLHRALDLPSQGRSLAVMGSTGSIGVSALRVLREHPGMFQVTGLAAGDNVQLLAEQAAEFRPRVLALRSEGMIPKLRELLPEGYQPEICCGQQGYVQLAGLPEVDLLLSAQVGAAGLASTLQAAQEGKVIALANKESLVLAGGLLRKACAKSEAAILPVDSEHNALFQGLQGQDWSEASRLMLTASGGPFLGWGRQELEQVSPKQALKHPNWSMGAKISIDSATMMNKGLEVIEACHLFGVAPEHLQVLVHPESIVHSLVQYQDGSFLAQMGIADMRIPIAFCLSYPHRLALELKPLDLVQVGSLSFRQPDPQAFPCLELAREAMAAGPSYPVALNAANEVAVEAFLEERIGFLDIAGLNQEALQKHQAAEIKSLEDVLEVDRQSREFVWDRLQAG